MESQNLSEVTSLDFFKDKNAKKYFAKVDYYLKSGGHIQWDYPLPSAIHSFVETNFDSLQMYYSEFFRVNLSCQGAEFERFYFIDFEERSKGELSKHYKALQFEYVVVGLMFLKFYKADGNVELNKVSDFINLLFVEYEDEKDALTRLIINSNQTKSSDWSDNQVNNTIKRAFKQFAKLGWINWEDDEEDRFRYLPSFERLRKLYDYSKQPC